MSALLLLTYAGPLSELKIFIGHLIQSVVAKLKAQFIQSSTDGARGALTAACGLRDEDVEAVCQDILRELVCHGDRQATTTTTTTTTQPADCSSEPPTVREPPDVEQSSTSLDDQHATERNKFQSQRVVCDFLRITHADRVIKTKAKAYNTHTVVQKWHTWSRAVSIGL